MMKPLGLLLMTMSLMSCSHGPKEGSTYYLGNFDGESTAPGVAYMVDGFHIQRQMVRRAKTPDHPYFHKVCELSDRKPHLSRRDYACSDLPWVTGPMGY